MTIFWNIFFTAGLIWFIMLLMRPVERTREEWAAYERDRKKRLYDQLSFWVNIGFACIALYVLYLIG